MMLFEAGFAAAKRHSARRGGAASARPGHWPLPQAARLQPLSGAAHVAAVEAHGEPRRESGSPCLPETSRRQKRRRLVRTLGIVFHQLEPVSRPAASGVSASARWQKA
jgi:hypothetical protein